MEDRLSSRAICGFRLLIHSSCDDGHIPKEHTVVTGLDVGGGRCVPDRHII